VEFGDRYSQASTYHQLGRVAQELREWDDARHNYHQALAIKVEFGDRYLQASTYHCLGNIAFDVEEIAEAQENFLQALRFWAEFNDEYSIQTFSVPALAKVYQTLPNPELLTTVAEIFGASESEVQQIFDSIDQGT
jgi:tetratricopeptide (TPR) repeat protein